MCLTYKKEPFRASILMTMCVCIPLSVPEDGSNAAGTSPEKTAELSCSGERW